MSRDAPRPSSADTDSVTSRPAFAGAASGEASASHRATGSVTSARPRASTRATVAVLTAGSFLSAGLFLVSVLLTATGRPGDGGPLLDPVSALADLAALDPSAWASMGIIVMLFTPVAGVMATTAEYWRAERRIAIVALVVLAVLAVSVTVALLR